MRLIPTFRDLRFLVCVSALFISASSRVANATAALDPSFGSGGIVRTQPSAATTSFSSAYGLALDSSGRLVTAGRSNGSNNDDTTLVRWRSAGTVDSGFGSGGKAVFDASGAGKPDGAYTLKLDSSNRIVVSGYATTATGQSIFAARLTPNGALDSSFGTGGIARLNPSEGGKEDASVSALATLDSGGVVLAGYSTIAITGGTRQWSTLIKLTSSGALDTTFGSGGIFSFNAGPGDSDSHIDKICPFNGGWLVAGSYADPGQGSYWGRSFIAVLTAYGTLNSSYRGNGIIQLGGPASWQNQHVTGLITTGNTTYVSGNFKDGGSFAIKLDNAFYPDRNFGTEGYASFTYDPNLLADNFKANDAAVDDKGRLVLAGVYSWRDTSNPAPRPVGFAAARLGTDGKPDGSFGTGGIYSFAAATDGSNTGEAQAMAVTPDRIYLAGYSQTGLSKWAFTGAALNFPNPTISVTGSSGLEKQLAGNGGLAFTIKMPAALEFDVRVDYNTHDGSAKAGSDYTALSGSVVIPAGQSSVVVRVPTFDDLDAEGDEVLYFLLSGSSVGTVNNGPGYGTTGTIQEDDTPTAINSSVSTDINTATQPQNLQASDPNNLPLTYTAVSHPQHGSLQLTQSTGQFVYTPTTGYAGDDSFDFKVNNGKVDSSRTARVTIGVVEAPSLVVTTLADTIANDNLTSLREALTYAAKRPGADTVSFAPGLHGSIVLASTLNVGSTVVIAGPGANQITLTRDTSGGEFSLLELGGPSNLFTIQGLTFTNGKAPMLSQGGALSCYEGSLIVRDCVFEKNDGAFGGGAIWGAQTVERCAFRSNTAVFGGAVYNDVAPMSVSDCYFGNNIAYGSGGALYSQIGAVTANQCTFWNNTATYGGAISGTTFTLRFCTFASNHVLGGGSSTSSPTPSAGGAVYSFAKSTDTGTISLSHCLISGNTSSGDGPAIYSPRTVNSDYNLIDIYQGAVYTGTTNLFGVDAKLDSAPRFNGGPTETIALLPGSAAVDAGDRNFSSTNQPYDQRGPGYARLKGTAVDIGAFEMQAALVPPVNVSANPTLPGTDPLIPQIISTQYSDKNGAADIVEARLFIGESLSTSKPYIALRYRAGKLYLLADNGVDYLGGFAPGSNNLISNSKCTVDCSTTVVATGGSTLVVAWHLTPKAGFTGAKSLYGLVIDKSNLQDGWDNLGSWTIGGGNVAPQLWSASQNGESSSPGVPQTFTYTYRDGNGGADIKDARIFIAASLSTSVPFIAARYFDGKLYLCSPDGKTYQGGFAPGTSNIISNQWASLDCSKTTVKVDGANLIVNWNITPKETFSGRKLQYYLVIDKHGLQQGWNTIGSWTVTTANIAPEVRAITPSTGTTPAGTARAITSTFRDGNGATDISEARLYVSASLAGGQPFIMARYYAGKLYLRSDDGKSYLGGFTPGSSNLINTNYGTLDCSKTTVCLMDDQLVVSWSLTPKANFTGDKILYGMVIDKGALQTDWTYRAEWKITTSGALKAQTPPASSHDS